MKWAWAVLAAAMVAGASAEAQSKWTEPLNGETKDYEPVEATYYGHQAGVHVRHEMEVMIRRFDRSGRLALCGYYIPESGVFSEIQDRWLKTATLETAGTSLSANFIVQVTPQFGRMSGNAQCVETNVPYSAKAAGAPIEIDGPPVQMDF